MGKEERKGMVVELDEVTVELTEVMWRIEKITRDLDELTRVLKNVTGYKLPTPEQYAALKEFANLEGIFEIVSKAQQLYARKRDLEKKLGVVMTKPE